jgi:hypothetical protein
MTQLDLHPSESGQELVSYFRGISGLIEIARRFPIGNADDAFDD